MKCEVNGRQLREQPVPEFETAIAGRIWQTKYRYRQDGDVPDGSVADTWRRVAGAIAAVEHERRIWAEAFYVALDDFKFLPGGRILAGAGTQRHVTLFNAGRTGNVASGPVSFMKIWDAACATLLSAGARRGGGQAIRRRHLRRSSPPCTSARPPSTGAPSNARQTDRD